MRTATATAIGGGVSAPPPTLAPTKRYTREVRQRIIREFAVRNGGIYDPKAFELEVRRTGKSHEAYAWFTWDKDEAALQHRLFQAREFAIGLKCFFTVKELGRNKKLRMVERDMPFVISPMASRAIGGGYYVTDPKDPDHMAELCRQAAVALRGWQARYSAAAAHVGQGATFATLLDALEAI